MAKKIISSSLFFVILVGSVSGQFLPPYGQYTMNKYYLNPAVAGYQGFTTINLTGREQWLGYAGTPKTHSLSVDTRFLNDSYIIRKRSVRKRKKNLSRESRVGLGFQFVNDRSGLLGKTGFEATYAYHITLMEGQLSMGLSLTFFQLKVHKDDLVLADEGFDKLIHGTKDAVWMPDGNLGLFYSTRNYYGGYSVRQILQSPLQFGSNGEEYTLERQHYLMGGYIWDIDQVFRLEPSMLLGIYEGKGATVDLSTKLTINKLYWGGLKYRSPDVMGIFGGIKYDRYYFGYSFEYNFKAVARSTYGTHEIMILIKLGDTARRYMWLDTY